MKKMLAVLSATLLLVSLLLAGCSKEPYADVADTPIDELTYKVNEDYVVITGFVGYSKTIKIPKTIEELPVTQIGMNAFWASEIETLILPDTITDIFNEAFANCKQLTTVHFNDGLINIHQSAFKDCIALERVSFPDTLELIGTEAFSHCTGMREAQINGTDLLIGMSAFNSNSSLETLTIDGTRRIMDHAFGSCDTLTDVKFLCDLPDSINGYTFRARNGSLPTLHYKKGAAGTDNPSLSEYTLEEY